MPAPDELLETDFAKSAPNEPEPSKPGPSLTEKMFAALRLHREKLTAYQASDEFRKSPFIKKWRKKDRDRQADGAWNKQRRNDYASLIWMTEDREVRPYDRITNSVAKKEAKQKKTRDRQAKFVANLTPEQLNERKLKKAEAERLRRATKKTKNEPDNQVK